MLSRLNPFRGLPNSREVWAWGMFDVANHSFSILVNTLFFALYFKNSIAPNPKTGSLLWGVSVAIGSLLVVLAAPVLGAIADFRASRKRWLFGCYACCVTLTCALALLRPGMPGATAIAMAVYIGAFFFFSTGENFLGSFLPDIAPPERMARVSAIGWSMGFLSTCIILPASLLITGDSAPTTGMFRAIFLFAGAWFAINAIPTFLFLRPGLAPLIRSGPSPGPLALVGIGFSRLGQTIREASKHRQFLRFLACFAAYSCGVKVVIYFSSIVAEEQFHFRGAKLTWFLTVIAVSAGVGALLTGPLGTRLGLRRTILLVLVAWIFASLGAALIPKTPAYEWAFWTFANGVGLALGATGAASRAFVGAVAPAEKSAEFFGLWGLAYAGAGIVGPLVFGGVRYTIGADHAMFVVTLFFALGLVGMLRVREPARVSHALTLEPSGSEPLSP